MTRIQIAKPELIRFFDSSPQRVYLAAQLHGILTQNRDEWHLAQRFTNASFIQFLVGKTDFKEIVLKTENTDVSKQETRYIWREASPYEVAISLKANSYLTHGSAVFLHALSDQIPRTIFVNYEQSHKLKIGNLTQEAINNAFLKPQRESGSIFNYKNNDIVLINGKYTDHLGVEELIIANDVRIYTTSLERTLIDIAVRPSYAGGVFKVAEVYRKVKEKISVNTLRSILKKLDYIYPYHQSIGFYMELSGFDEKRLSIIDSFPKQFDFYLDYKMSNCAYSKRWRLFYPSEI